MANTEIGVDGRYQSKAGTEPRTVLCLHCSTGSSRQWRALAETLGDGYRIIAPDLLGYGGNVPWMPERTLRLETEVGRLLPLLHRAAGPVDVVAHSFGAAVAVKLALDHPDKVRSLTLYEPVLFGLLTEEPDAAEALGEIDATSGRIGAALADGNVDAAARHFIDFWCGGGTWNGMPETRREGVRACIQKVRADFGALLADETTRSDLARLDMPVLCLSGARSPAATRRIAKILSSTFPRAKSRRFEDAGHMGPLTHAGEVNACIAEFFRFLFRPQTEHVPYTPLAAHAA